MEKVALLVPILPFFLHNYLFLEFSPCYKIWKDITKSFVELRKTIKKGVRIYTPASLWVYAYLFRK